MGLNDVELYFFVLLEGRTENESGEKKEDSKLEAVIVDAAKYEQSEGQSWVVLVFVDHFDLLVWHYVVVQKICDDAMND